MIKNFEKQTSPLTRYEKEELVPLAVDVLRHCIGKKYALSNKNFLNRWGGGYKIGPARLRKIINYIRNRGLIKGLVANGRGYYIAQSREELENYIESLKGREDALKQLRRSITRQMDKLFPKAKVDETLTQPD